MERNTRTPKRARRQRRVFLGVVGVDTGQLMVMDPGYVDSEWERGDDPEHPFGGGSYGKACEASSNPTFDGQLTFKAGHPGLGVVFGSGYGDGIYEVWGTLNDEGYISKVEIMLIPNGR